MIVFDRNGFRDALNTGLCDPPELLTPLVQVSRSAYSRLENSQERSLRDHYSKAASRMTSAAFGHLRVGAEHAIRAAPNYFPAYEFHVGELINDDWLSAVDWHKDFHRDHMCHQLMCVYVGRKILESNTCEFDFGGRTLLDNCLDAVMYNPECAYLRDYLISMGAPTVYHQLDRRGRIAWRQLFLESFFLACMYHDIGYPWQFVNRINSQLQTTAPLFNPAGCNSAGLYEHYRNRLVMYPFNGYQPCQATQPVEWSQRARTALQTGLSRTHGVPGAFAFLHLNDVIRKYPRQANIRAPSRFCIEWAAMAIAMHDLQKVYAGDKCEPQPQLKVLFRRDPLSFVLTLVDQLQDFGRPNATFTRCGTVKIDYKACCHRVEVESGPAPNNLMIRFYFNDKDDARMNILKCKPDAERDYFHPKDGYLDGGGLPMPKVSLRAFLDPSGKW